MKRAGLRTQPWAAPVFRMRLDDVNSVKTDYINVVSYICCKRCVMVDVSFTDQCPRRSARIPEVGLARAGQSVA